MPKRVEEGAVRRQVMSVLGRLAFGADLLEQPQAAAYARAAQAIRTLRGELVELSESGELTKVRGIGPSTALLIERVIAGETPEQLAAFEAQLPEGLWDIRKVRGLGPKKVRTLWKDLGVTTLGELEYACTENRLVSLRGFGDKTQQKVLGEIERIRATHGLCRLDQALAAAREALATLGPAVLRAAMVGPLRRGCEVVPGVDLLVVEASPGAARLDNEGIEIRVHVVDDAHFATQRVLLTGSEGHVVKLRARARERGLDLEALEAADEDAVYAALGLHLPPCERREDDSPLVEIGRAGPRLVQRKDLLGALHNHTVASDGRNTLAEMRNAAAAVGLTYLGISDHSVSAFYARGLEAGALVAQAADIAKLNQDTRCTLLTGVESDILADGALDYDDHVLAALDVVIASVHSRHGQDPEAMTARMVAAARNPWTDVIGHPTGRLLLGRAPSEYDVEAMLDACAQSGCAVELNCSPARLDLNERHLAMAKERGVLVSIAADAHSVEGLHVLSYGVTIARRAGLTPDDVLNCRPLPALREWLAQRRA